MGLPASRNNTFIPLATPVDSQTQNDLQDYVVSLHKFPFGDGSDGDVVLGAGLTTMVRDMFYNNLTLGATSQLAMNGFRLFVKATLTTVPGSLITADGVDAHSFPSPTGTILGGAAGGVGGPNAGGAAANSFGGNGGPGGASGANLGGAGGVASVPAAPLGGPRSVPPSLAGFLIGIAAGTAALTGINGGAGGGGGGWTSGGAAPPGGTGGGVGVISACRLALSGAGDIRAKGGKGADAGGSVAAGGGGGGGGTLIVIYGSKASPYAFTPALNTPGGLGGVPSAGQTAGTAGANGAVFDLFLGSPTGALASPSGTGHVERGIAVFTGAEDFIDVVFASAFPIATGAQGYWVSATAFVNELDGMVSVDIRNKAVGSMRLEPSARFVGEIHWKAES